MDCLVIETFGLIEGVALIDILPCFGVAVFIDICFLGEVFGGGDLVDDSSAKSPQSPKESSSSNGFSCVFLWIGN